MTPPKLKRDWVGLRVRSLRELTNGMYRMPAGTLFTVGANHGGLRLSGDPCKQCGVSVFVSKVHERDVEIIGRAK